MKKFIVKILLILALWCALSQSYSIESGREKKHKNFDGGVVSRPMKVFNGKSKVKTNKREIDNVRGENMPKSREDIQNIKKLTYHGKMSPRAEALIKITSTTSTTTTTQRPHKRRYRKKNPPVNRADRIIIRKKFKPSPKLPTSNEIVRSAITKPEKPNYVPDDTPFYPLMRPSPINVMPTEPPSFDTVRNYVQYLKMRNEKNFAEINADEGPLAMPLSQAQKKKSKVPFDGELEYFKEREKEIVKEQQRNRSSASDELNSSSASIEDNDHHHEQPSYKVHENNDNYDEIDESQTSEDYGDNTNDESRNHEFVPFKLYAQVRHAEAEHIEPSVKPHLKEKVSLAKKNIYYKEEGYDDQMHDKGSEELKYKFDSKKKGKKRPRRSSESKVDNDESSLKFKNSEKIHKKSKNVPENLQNISDESKSFPVKSINGKFPGKSQRTKISTKSKISLASQNPQSAKISAAYQNAKISAKSKRSVDELPVALALFKKSELPNLTGEKLLKHLDELIKNSSVYISDDDDPKRPIRIVSQKPSARSQKFPFYNLSDNVLSQMSAHRYSEHFHKYPKHKESLYSSKNIKDCHEIDDEVEIDPESEEQHPPPRRLNNLGSKIECLKLKYFGKDPFDNPLFKEDEYVAATIPLPLNHTNVISRQANPLINVYDDVIRTIRAENFEEKKKTKNQEVVKDSVKLASENIPISVTTPPRIPNYSSVAGVSQLPIFDINKFLPKFRPAFNTDLDKDIDITELLYGKNTTEKYKAHFTTTTPTPTQPTNFKRPNRQNSIASLNGHKIDSSSLIEKPKVKRNYKAKPLSERASQLKATVGNNKGPAVTIQKFRRVTPHKSHSSHPPTRPSGYRFKFL